MTQPTSPTTGDCRLPALPRAARRPASQRRHGSELSVQIRKMNPGKGTVKNHGAQSRSRAHLSAIIECISRYMRIPGAAQRRYGLAQQVFT